MPIAIAAVQPRKIGADVLAWFDGQYPMCSFHGRFQIGVRKAGEQGIFPLFTGEREAVRDFLARMTISPKLDYYITANSVSGVKRSADQLFALHNIVMDVDAHQIEAHEADALEDLWWRMRRDLFLPDELPEPSAVINTGRGLQLWWCIVPVSAKCLCYYDEITGAFAQRIKCFLEEYSHLSCFHVDRGASQNPIGYFRLPGTFNTKSQTSTQLIFCQKRQYTTHELLPLVKSWPKEPPPSPRRLEDAFAGQYAQEDIFLLKDIRTTGFFRVRQMIQLRMLRNNDVGAETRNNLCLIVYNAMVHALGHEEAWDKLLAFNRGFKQPMTERELHQTIDTSRKKNGYRFRNKTIIGFLEITPEEQKAIGLYEPTAPYCQMTRLSGHPARKAAAKTVRDHRNQKICDLADQGMSRKEIARVLEIDRNTVAAVLGKSADRYEEAVALFAEGLDHKKIAAKLGVSLRTVQRYEKKWEATSAEKLPYI